jgi:mRNA interferase YafQ
MSDNKLSVKDFFNLLAEVENAVYDVDYTNAFKKNVKRCYKRNLNLYKLVEVITILARTGVLPQEYRPHFLESLKCMECHIAPDWLLLWRQNEQQLILMLTNTGTHADLLGM